MYVSNYDDLSISSSVLFSHVTNLHVWVSPCNAREWSITDETPQTVGCSMFIGHRISCYSPYCVVTSQKNHNSTLPIANHLSRQPLFSSPASRFVWKTLPFQPDDKFSFPLLLFSTILLWIMFDHQEILE